MMLPACNTDAARSKRSTPSQRCSWWHGHLGLEAGWSRRGKYGIIVVCYGGTRWLPHLWFPMQGAEVHRTGSGRRVTRGTFVRRTTLMGAPRRKGPCMPIDNDALVY